MNILIGLVALVLVQAGFSYLYVTKLKAENETLEAQLTTVIDQNNQLVTLNKSNVAQFEQYREDLKGQFEIITEVIETSNQRDEEVTLFRGELMNVPVSTACVESEPVRRTLEFLRNRH